MATAKLPGGRRIDLHWLNKSRRGRKVRMIVAVYRGGKGSARGK